LPGQVLRGGAGDELPESFVLDPGQGLREVFGQRVEAGRRAPPSTIGGPPEPVDDSYPKPQGGHRDAPLAQARRDLVAQQRQLARPDAGGHTNEQHSTIQLYGARPIGDPDSDGLSPDALGDRRLRPRRAGPPGGVDRDLEPLGHHELGAPAPERAHRQAEPFDVAWPSEPTPRT
jgi:hypothetical protein